MMVNLVGAPGERVQYLKVKLVLEVKEEKQVEAIKPTLPRVTDLFQTYLRELRPSRSQRLGRTVSPQGRADQARQYGGGAATGERGAVQGNRRPVTGRISASWLVTRTRWTRTPLPPNGKRRWIPRIPAEAAEAAAANELSESMALQWAAMVEDGSRDFGNKNRRRAGSVAGRNRQSARFHRRRRQSRRQFRHSRHHQFRDGVLRASADARNRVRPPGAADDHELAQLHLRQRRSLARPHHLGPLRRLHEFDSAAGGAQRVQGRGVGKFRPRHGRFQPDLFDHRRAARRPPRPDLAAHRRPALHHDRNQSGQAAGRGRAGRRRAGVPAAVAGDVLDRPAGNQSALRRDQPARQCRDPGAPAHRHGRPRRQYRIAAALRHHRADPPGPAADVHGRKVRPRSDLGRAFRHRSGAGRDRRRCRAVRGQHSAQAADEAEGRRHPAAGNARRRAGVGPLRQRHLDRRAHGPGRRPRRHSRHQAVAQAAIPPSRCSRRPTSKPS